MSHYSLVHTPRFAADLSALDIDTQGRIIEAIYALLDSSDLASELQPVRYGRPSLVFIDVNDHRVIISAEQSELTLVALQAVESPDSIT